MRDYIYTRLSSAAMDCRISRQCVSATHLETTLLLTALEGLDGDLGSVDTRSSHGAESRAHAVGAIEFRQLHTADNHARDDLTGTLDDGVLSSVHVKTAHAAKCRGGLHGDETLDAESTHRTVVTGGGDDDRGVDGVGVHAAKTFVNTLFAVPGTSRGLPLIVVVHRDQSPVGDYTSNGKTILVIVTGDQVLNASSIEELDIGEAQDLAEEGAGEERGVLDNDIAGMTWILLVGNTNFAEESIGRLPHDHGREELSAKPSTATGGDTSLDDSDLQVRTLLGQAVSGAETTAACTNDDNVRLGIVVQVGEVAASHGAGDL